MSKYYTTKYMETETIFRCVTGDIFRFYEAFCGASTGILFLHCMYRPYIRRNYLED